jgi:hypothetical protein
VTSSLWYKAEMGKFFAPNITALGRVARAVWGFGLIGAGVLLFSRSRWVAAGLGLAGAFARFEAVRGWCVMRACGIKTKM